MQRTRNQQSKRAERRGSVLVEFAMVCPILVVVLFSFIEFDRYILVIHATEEAARMGGRTAILSTATDADVKTRVDGIMKTFGVSKHVVTVTPSLSGTIPPGNPVTVTVDVKYDDVSWLPVPKYLAGKTISVSNTLPKEK